MLHETSKLEEKPLLAIEMSKILAVKSNHSKILQVTPRQETLLLRKLENLEIVNNDLELMKNCYEERMRKCNLTKISLEKKQYNLKIDMDKFKSFIAENAQKRRRSRICYEQESRLVGKYERELFSLEMQLNNLKKKFDWLFKAYENYQPIIRYLNLIVDQLPKDYLKQNDDPMKSLIIRYENLALKREAFQITLNKLIEGKKSIEKQSREELECHNLTIFEMNSKISNLYAVKDENTIKINSKVCGENSADIIRKQLLEFGIVMRSIENICAKSVKDYEKIDHNDWSVETKLSRIKSYIHNSEAIISKVTGKPPKLS